jgi:hypothetical protein
MKEKNFFKKINVPWAQLQPTCNLVTGPEHSNLIPAQYNCKFNLKLAFIL